MIDMVCAYTKLIQLFADTMARGLQQRFSRRRTSLLEGWLGFNDDFSAIGHPCPRIMLQSVSKFLKGTFIAHAENKQQHCHAYVLAILHLLLRTG
jgi:hypothetical protein